MPDEPGTWPARRDPFSSYRAGFEVRTYRNCQRVLMFHHFPGEEGVGSDCLVRSTDLTYSHEQNPTDARNPVYTFLTAVTQTGYKRDGAGYLKRSLPPVEFEYSLPIVQDRVEEVDPQSLENLPAGVDGELSGPRVRVHRTRSRGPVCGEGDSCVAAVSARRPEVSGGSTRCVHRSAIATATRAVPSGRRAATRR